MHKFLLILSRTFYHHLVGYRKLQPPHHFKNVPWSTMLPPLPQTSSSRSPPLLQSSLAHIPNMDIAVPVMEEALIGIERNLGKEDKRSALSDLIHRNITIMRGGTPFTIHRRQQALR